MCKLAYPPYDVRMCRLHRLAYPPYDVRMCRLHRLAYPPYDVRMCRLHRLAYPPYDVRIYVCNQTSWNQSYVYVRPCCCMQTTPTFTSMYSYYIQYIVHQAYIFLLLAVQKEEKLKLISLLL